MVLKTFVINNIYLLHEVKLRDQILCSKIITFQKQIYNKKDKRIYLYSCENFCQKLFSENALKLRNEINNLSISEHM